jgi:hypothetical protein
MPPSCALLTSAATVVERDEEDAESEPQPATPRTEMVTMDRATKREFTWTSW